MLEAVRRIVVQRPSADCIYTPHIRVKTSSQEQNLVSTVGYARSAHCGNDWEVSASLAWLAQQIRQL